MIYEDVYFKNYDEEEETIYDRVRNKNKKNCSYIDVYFNFEDYEEEYDDFEED